MADIEYSIEFHSYWHCGSGLSSGSDADAVVIKDSDLLPYIPGRTIKGLVKEAMENIRCYRGEAPDLSALFGKEGNQSGSAFFSNAVLSDNDRTTIVTEKLAEGLYTSISSTKIDDDGIAAPRSLRKIEVTVPCSLHGKVTNVPDDLAVELQLALKFIRRIGVNRNRGLGRCTITVR